MPTFFNLFYFLRHNLPKKTPIFRLFSFFFFKTVPTGSVTLGPADELAFPSGPGRIFSGKKLLFLISHCFFLTQFQLLKLTLRLFDTFFCFLKKIKLKRFLLTIKN